METRLTRAYHRWLAALMLLIIASSVSVWYFTRDTLPRTARLATGATGGVFYSLGQHLAEAYDKATAHRMVPLSSQGSIENRELLQRGQVEVAFLQGDSLGGRGVHVIAPLYLEMIHVIVRRESDIRQMNDLAGKTVVLGPAKSGMRNSAATVLEHYGLADRIIDAEEHYFLDLLTDESLDAAIVTTGILNADLVKLARTGEFRLLPLSAGAIEAKHPFFYRTSIPAGLYHENPAVPAADIETVGATAYLAVNRHASERFIGALLESLHEQDIAMKFPNLIPYHKALDRTPAPLHGLARKYFNPPDQLDFFSQLLESLAAIKELILALAAGCWLVWDRWNLLRQRERDRLIAQQKDYLDSFLSKTLEIESAHMDTTDTAELKDLLDEVTRIKLTALQELTEEDLRSDRAFIIFLTQCANLINKIQFKIAHGAALETHPVGSPDP